MLWAWERASDLRGLPHDAGVAFLASTITLVGGEVEVWPRFQPLQLTPGAFRMAVIRIRTIPDSRLSLTVKQRRATVDAIVDTVRIVRTDALQLDFDARASEKSFYAALIRGVRESLGPNRFLSITALVSWCGASSTWLNTLPVDEVVPMTFEMGSGTAAIETMLRSGGNFENPRCQDSIGISSRDVPVRARGYRRVYVFQYDDWTEALVGSVLDRFR
jgi:hypothetical protein